MPSPTRLLAPLAHLPTFELAARHLSFKRAAAELHLTPSAVSQPMRSLEEALGLPLFRRKTRALALTLAGEQFAALVADTLEGYRRGTERLLRQHGRRLVRLSTDPFVAHEILIPALHTLAGGTSLTDLRIETSTKVADLEREDLDAAVRYGVGPWPGLSNSTLCEVLATAVCAPGLLKGGRVRSPAGLARYPLISLRDQPDPWDSFARLFGVVLPPERLVFDSYFASIRAAEKGLGIAAGLFPVTSAAVLEGRLVTPLSLRVRVRARFHFVCRSEDAAQLPFKALREWLRSRFAELPGLPEGRGWTTLDEP